MPQCSVNYTKVGFGLQRIVLKRKISMTTISTEQKPVLDACCGSRMMWFDKNNPLATFCDIRQETITVTDRTHREDGTRTVEVNPDTISDFRDMPFSDNSFNIVAFDPPHLERAGKKSWLAAKYGKLSDNWRDDLRQGFAECLRVLKPGGTLVFKWNESQVKVREVIELAPIAPLFGQVSGRNGMTHWLVFMKPVVATNEFTQK